MSRQPETPLAPSKAVDERAADLELARRCQNGNAAAFEEIYRQHAGRLYSVLVRMVGSAAEAEDLLQEVFLQAHRALGSYRGEASLGTWLHRLAVHRAIDALRGRAARMARDTDPLGEGANEPAAAGALAPFDRLDLERAIAQLPDGYRAAFVLHDVEGFDHREVSELLGISEGTSKSQVHKARMKLRGLLNTRVQPGQVR